MEIAWFFANLGYLGDKIQIIQLYLHYNIMPNYISVLGLKQSNA